MTEAATKNCEGCGGQISAEQIVQRQAGLVQGVLLCPVCVDKKRKEMIAAQKAADEKISLEEPDHKAANEPSKIRSFAAGSTLAGAHHDASLKRSVTGPADPPTRIRTFHSKLTPAALAHMDDLVNEWIDNHPEIFIKKTNVTVGPFEAKHVEQHLILTIFY